VSPKQRARRGNGGRRQHSTGGGGSVARPFDLPAELRAELQCKDCDSDVSAVRVGSRLRVDVRHDHTCPWHRRASDGQPLTIVSALDPKRRVR